MWRGGGFNWFGRRGGREEEIDIARTKSRILFFLFCSRTDLPPPLVPKQCLFLCGTVLLWPTPRHRASHKKVSHKRRRRKNRRWRGGRNFFFFFSPLHSFFLLFCRSGERKKELVLEERDTFAELLSPFTPLEKGRSGGGFHGISKRNI